MCVAAKRYGRVEGCVCVWLVGVIDGKGTCIIDLLLEASCTLGGIKMIYGLFSRLIPVILRYQTALFCSWQWGKEGCAHPRQQSLHTLRRGQESFSTGAEVII